MAWESIQFQAKCFVPDVANDMVVIFLLSNTNVFLGYVSVHIPYFEMISILLSIPIHVDIYQFRICCFQPVGLHKVIGRTNFSPNLGSVYFPGEGKCKQNSHYGCEGGIALSVITSGTPFTNMDYI